MNLNVVKIKLKEVLQVYNINKAYQILLKMKYIRLIMIEIAVLENGYVQQFLFLDGFNVCFMLLVGVVILKPL